MIHRQSPVLLAVSMVLALVVGCSGGDDASGETPRPEAEAEAVPATTAAQLAGTSWRLERIGEDPISTSGDEPTLAFAEDRISGNSGCNQFSAAVHELGDSALSLGPAMSTRRACPPEIMDLEAEFLEALAGVTGWRVESERLVLTGREADLAFVRVADEGS